MPNIKSQIKRVQVSADENARNTAKKTQVKNSIKKFNAAVEAGDIALAEKTFKVAQSEIDSARIYGIYHINTAARKIATLNKQLDALKKATPAPKAEEVKPAKKVAEVKEEVKEEKPKRATRKKAEKAE